MKKLCSIILIICSSFCIAQSDEPFYEQIALEFYSTKILEKSDINVRLKINGDLYYPIYINANCLINKIINEKNFSVIIKNNFDTFFLDLNKIDKKKFKKVKKLNTEINKENYILVSRAIEFENRLFVIIREQVNFDNRGFTFEFDSNGNIIDWCQSSKGISQIIK